LNKKHFFHIVIILICSSFSFGQNEHSDAYNHVSSSMARANSYFYSNIDSFNITTEKAFQDFREDYYDKVSTLERNELIARYYNAKAAYLQANGLVQESLIYMDSAIHYSKDIANESLKANFYDNYGVMLQDAGDVFNSIQNNEKAIDIRIKINDTLGLAYSYNNIGFVYYKQKLLDNALEYFDKSIQLYRSTNNFSEAIPRSNVADIFREQEDLENYLKNIQRIYDLAVEFDKELYIQISYAKFGYYYMKKGELDTASILLLKSENYFAESKNNKKLALIYSDLAQLYVQKNNKRRALSFALKAKTSTEKIDLRATKVLVYKMLSEIYADIDMKNEALIYLSAHHSLKDSLENEEFYRDQLFKHSEIKYKAQQDSLQLVHDGEMKIAEEKTKLAEEKLKSEEQLIIFIVMGVIALLIMTLVIFRNYRLKQKYVQESFEKEQLMNKHLSEELKAKTKKLVNSSLKNVKNQNAIQKIENLIGEISKMESEEFEKNVQQIKSEIRDSKFTSKKLDNYKKRVTSENESFTSILKSKYPKLTPKELKICVLLRMNYSTDEICDVLGTSTSTLKTSRYRIHKKMNLEKGARLQDYIIQLS
jgi:DNA-binding CsgD family transcriptional regulator/tetratricopeptide (TPR) repeat protein